MLKEKKLALEKKLSQEVTWDVFFNSIELKIFKEEGKKDGK